MGSIYLRRKKAFTFPELLFDACIQLRLSTGAAPEGTFCNQHDELFECLEWLSSASRITNCSLWKWWSELTSEMFLVFPFQNHIIHFSAHNRSVWEFSLRWLNYLLIALLCVVNRFSQGLLSLPLSFKLMFVHVCVRSSSCHVFWLSNVYYTSDKYPREIM